MDRLVQEQVAAGAALAAPAVARALLQGTMPAVDRDGDPHVTKGAGRGHRAQGHGGRACALLMGDAEVDALSRAGAHCPIRLLQGQSQRLFDQDVLAGERRRLDQIGVAGGRRADRDDVDLRRLHEALGGVVGAAAELPGQLLAPPALQIADRDQLGAGDRLQAGRVPATDPPAADDAEPDPPLRCVVLRGRHGVSRVGA